MEPAFVSRSPLLSGSCAREGQFLFAITDRGEGAAPADGSPTPRLRRAEGTRARPTRELGRSERASVIRSRRFNSLFRADPTIQRLISLFFRKKSLFGSTNSLFR
jgi:hypothetical protein